MDNRIIVTREKRLRGYRGQIQGDGRSLDFWCELTIEYTDLKFIWIMLLTNATPISLIKSIRC